MYGAKKDETPSKGGKRPRSESFPHPPPRRKMRVPDGEGDLAADILEFHMAKGGVYDPSESWHSLLNPPRPTRVLPHSQILASAISNNNKTLQAPIFQEFFAAVGLPPDGVKKNANKTNGNDENIVAGSQPQVEELDDPSNSTMSKTQHNRYLKLSGQKITTVVSNRWTPSDKKHWRQLKTLVHAERRQYLAAVSRFWQSNRERVLIGFSSPKSAQNLRECANFAANNQQLQGKDCLQELISRKEATRFGRCKQVFSLQPQSAEESKSTDIETLGDFKVLESDGQNSDGIVIAEALPSVGTKVTPPTRENPTSLSVPNLRDDTKALKLAAKHKAAVVVTDRVLEALLRIPGDFSSRWRILVHQSTIGKSKLLVLEDPLLQGFVSPRECLTEGIEEGLYQNMSSGDGAREGNSKQRFVFTLWTLPRTRRGRPLKVLVRSTVRLWERSSTGMVATLDGVNDGNLCPMRIRAHVDYFPERGREMISPYEGSLWILDQLLSNHLVRTHTVRIDARTGKILEWMEGSLAQALVVTDMDVGIGGKNLSPFQGFAALFQVLTALPTLDFRQERASGGGKTATQLLCLPGQVVAPPKPPPGQSHLNPGNLSYYPSNPTAVSVHAPASTEEQDDGDDDDKEHAKDSVDIDMLIKKAGGVLLSADALEHCTTQWKWEKYDQIPYTFPPKPKE